MSLFEFILLSLACWRITHLFTGDEPGPWDIVINTRLWSEKHNKFINGLLSCPYCFSVWASAMFTAMFFVDWRQAVVLWLSLSGATILIEETRRRIEV